MILCEGSVNRVAVTASPTVFLTIVNIFHTIHGPFGFQENIYSCVKPVDHLRNSGRHLGFACTSCVTSVRESPGLQDRWHRLAHACATWWHYLLEWIEHVPTTLGTSREGWSPLCSLWWPCGPETCFFFGCLLCYIFWLEVPKIQQGLGHSLADWCFYNMMPECVLHSTRMYGGIWKPRVSGVGVGGLSLVEEAELGIICMSGVCCLYQLCLLLLWEGRHLFILGKSLRVISWLYP